MSVIDEIKMAIESYYEIGGPHDFDHALRVYYFAQRIGLKESNVDMEVLLLAALLHDIARKKQSEGIVRCHAQEGAKLCIAILRKYEIDEKKIEKISYCIASHRKSKGIVPESIEAKILQDADRLDNIGAVGIMRTIACFSKYKMIIQGDEPHGYRFESLLDEPKSIYGWLKSLTFIDENEFYTSEAKLIYRTKINHHKQFLNNFVKEIEDIK